MFTPDLRASVRKRLKPLRYAELHDTRERTRNTKTEQTDYHGQVVHTHYLFRWYLKFQ